MYRGRRQPVFQRLRPAAGEELILGRNVLVEQIPPASVLRPLTEAEMGKYRRPARLAAGRTAVPGGGRA
jgi:haloalkane dehalogenase